MLLYAHALCISSVDIAWFSFHLWHARNYSKLILNPKTARGLYYLFGDIAQLTETNLPWYLDQVLFSMQDISYLLDHAYCNSPQSNVCLIRIWMYLMWDCLLSALVTRSNRLSLSHWIHFASNLILNGTSLALVFDVSQWEELVRFQPVYTPQDFIHLKNVASSPTISQRWESQRF